MSYEEAQCIANKMLWQCVREDWRKIVLLALVLVGAGVGAAYADTQDADIERVEIERMSFGSGVTVIHDNSRNVTCWVFDGVKSGGISCLPDWMLVKQGGDSSETEECLVKDLGKSQVCKFLFADPDVVKP